MERGQVLTCLGEGCSGQVQSDLLEKEEIRGFVIFAVEGYSINFVCSDANVNECN